MTNMPADIYAAWRATFTARWHANPDLCERVDLVSGHSGRVVLLLGMLFPNCGKALLWAGVLHDLGESGVGDVARPAKLEDPVLAEATERAEARKLAGMGVAMPELSDLDQQRLKLCDALDAYLWAMRANPFLRGAEGWVRSGMDIVDLAERLGVGFEVGIMVQGASLWAV